MRLPYGEAAVPREESSLVLSLEDEPQGKRGRQQQQQQHYYDANEDVEENSPPHDNPTTAVVKLLERFAEKMTPIEAECIRRLTEWKERLERGDETFDHWELSNLGGGNNESTSSSSTGFSSFVGTTTELLLEHAAVQEALADCCRAASRSTTLKSLTISCGLPEQELERYVLANLPVTLERLTIGNTSRSQTIAAAAFVHRLPNTLTHVNVDVRIRLRHSHDACLLSHGLSKLVRLEHLELHILPRLAIHRNDHEFTLDCLVRAMTMVCAVQKLAADNGGDEREDNDDGEANKLDDLDQQQPQQPSPTITRRRCCQRQHHRLHTLKWTAGYRHNYYQRSLIHPDVLGTFMTMSRDSLEWLQLDNFGLRDVHLRTIIVPPCGGGGTGGGHHHHHSPHQYQQLKRLRLAHHHPDAFSLSPSNQRLLLEQSNLHECILWDEQEQRDVVCDGRQTTSAVWQFQRQLHLHCLVRKCSQTSHSFGAAVLMAALDHSDQSLGAVYALVRYNPSSLITTIADDDTTPVVPT